MLLPEPLPISSSLLSPSSFPSKDTSIDGREYFSVMRVEKEKELFDEESEVVDNEPLVGQISFEELLSELRL